jgi:hypothetical protein
MVLTAWIALAALFTQDYVFAHLDHDCTGADCPVCVQIETAQNLLKGLVLASLMALFSGLHLRTKTAIQSIKLLFTGLTTPITLKVKCNT